MLFTDPHRRTHLAGQRYGSNHEVTEVLKKILLVLAAIVLISNWTWARLPAKPTTGGQYASVLDRSLHYSETKADLLHTGSLPVVLIHGMPGTYLDFEKVVPMLKGYRTISIDRPNYGWSSGGTLDYQSQLAAIHELLVQKGIKQAIFVGHSFGGSLSLGMAIRYPKDVAAMVLAAPGAGGHKPSLTRKLQARFTQVLMLPVIRQVSALTFSNVALHVSATTGAKQAFSPLPVNPVYQERTLAVAVKPNSLKAFSNDAIGYPDVSDWLVENVPQIRTPSTTISATGDELIPIENGRNLSKALLGTKFIPVSGGHMVPYSHPDVIAREVKRFELFARAKRLSRLLQAVSAN
ncbi:MAG: alpha/beta hydrolase [Thermoleophilaceae bacterium]|nr:alpha/beta hydrolase [Thermoleophilaceae bacterium]